MSAMTPKMPGTYRQKAVGQKMHLNIRPLLFELGAAHTAHLWLGQPLNNLVVSRRLSGAESERYRKRHF
jgi:hypothetical protein